MEIVIDQHYTDDDSLAALDIMVALHGPLQKTSSVNVSISIVQLDKAGLQLQSWLKRLLIGGSSPSVEEEEETPDCKFPPSFDASSTESAVVAELQATQSSTTATTNNTAATTNNEQDKVIKCVKNFESFQPLPALDNSKFIQQLEASVSALGNDAIELCDEGTGGAYFIKGQEGDRLAIFKPHDEEPGSPGNPKTPVLSEFESISSASPGRKGIRLGEAALRERAAFLLDRQGFFDVPFTTLAEMTLPSNDSSSSSPSKKFGSLQQFVPNLYSCMDIGAGNFPAHEVHKIGILDIQMFNTDRHGGNILVQKGSSSSVEEDEQVSDSSLKLIPIDHGYCLPDTLSEAWFDWLYWPQAKQPFNTAAKEYVEQIDVERDVKMLQEELAIRPECLKTMKISTMLLKKGVRAGLTLFDIGNLICRREQEESSPLEKMCAEAEGKQLINNNESLFFSDLGEIMDKEIQQLQRQQQQRQSPQTSRRNLSSSR